MVLPKDLAEIVLDYASPWYEKWREIVFTVNHLCPAYYRLEGAGVIFNDNERHLSWSMVSRHMLDSTKSLTYGCRRDRYELSLSQINWIDPNARREWKRWIPTKRNRLALIDAHLDTRCVLDDMIDSESQWREYLASKNPLLHYI